MHRQPVDSESLRAVGYDRRHAVLEVEFASGGLYRYFDVPEPVYRQLLQAESLGGWFNGHFKPMGFRYRQLDH